MNFLQTHALRVFDFWDVWFIQFMITDYGKASLNEAFTMKKTIYDEKNNLRWKKHFTMKKTIYYENWTHDVYLNVCVCDDFELPEMAKKWSFGHFRPNLPQLGLFHRYFLCKSNFRVISMIKIVILDQSKPISLYLKIKNF